METFIDHLVVVAPDLAAGASHISTALGMELQRGGAHPRMATHNLLLRLGESIYLEVIAADPAAAPPGRPRWFDLDRLTAGAKPRLATWVVRTADIRATSSRCADLLGPVEAMSRDSLAWLITVPADGGLPLGGAAPALIQWQNDFHPAGKLIDRGCALHKLEIFHAEPDRVRELLRTVGLASPVTIHPLPAASPPFLRAQIQTPRGIRTL